METIADRVKNLCDKNHISLTELERILGFSKSSIRKWGSLSYPSIDKIIKVANYFGVSTDYIAGATDIKSPVTDILNDSDFITFQRAKEAAPDRYKIAKEIIQAGFDIAFEEGDKLE